MVRLIVGSKGSGKTKKLISRVNEAAEVSKGNVVCIEKGNSLRYDINHHVRLIDINEYSVTGADAYYGFIAGLLAGNYDITDIFGDATFKILYGKGGKDTEGFADFALRLSQQAKSSDICIYLTVSCDAGELPERIKDLII